MSRREIKKEPPSPPRIPEMRPGKRGGKRDENRRRKVRALCDAALGRMLRIGFETVTVEQIAKDAGVAKGSFYRYFESKEELTEALLAPLRSAVGQAFDLCESAIADAEGTAQLNEAYQSLAGALEQVMLQFPREILLYLQECRGPRVGSRVAVRTLSDEIAARAVGLTRVAQERGLLGAFPPQISALTVVGAAERLLFEVLSGGDVGPPREAAGWLIGLIMDGMRVRS